MRNALIPILTNIALALPGIFVGSFLIEVFFSIPGLGREVLLAVNRSDYPVIQAVTIYLAVLTMLINLIADVLYKVVDPRVVSNERRPAATIESFASRRNPLGAPGLVAWRRLRSNRVGVWSLSSSPVRADDVLSALGSSPAIGQKVGPKRRRPSSEPAGGADRYRSTRQCCLERREAR